MRILLFLGLTLLSIPGWGEELRRLRLHGSNTLGAELAPSLVKRWLQGMGYKDIDERRSAAAELVISARAPGANLLQVEIKAHGSSTGFRSLKAGVTDIAMSSRPIKAHELEQLKQLGEMDGPKSEYVVGLDGIAVVVHRDNPLRQISKGQLRRIFAGEVLDWAELGGAAGPIRLYARDDNSGTYDTFRSLVLGKKKLGDAARRYESNAELSDAVSQDALGIGFVGLPYIRSARALAVADDIPLAIMPNRFSVATEDYVLARRLYFYLPEQTHPLARSLAEYALSAQGQQVVAETGFVSQQIITGHINAGVGHAEYFNLVKGAQRLSLNFRFQPGSSLLDNKARQDIWRLVDYLGRLENRQRKLILVGFSDSNESIPMQSLGLSILRADGVADLLLSLGVAPRKVRGYGPAVTVASNETAQGREKNRRVEVWLR